MLGSRDGGWKTGVRRAIRVLVILTVLAVLLVLVYVNVAPFGASVVLKVSPGQGAERVKFTNPFTTSTELGSDGRGGIVRVPRLKMTTDEVTFALEVPYQRFTSMEAKIRYRGDPSEFDIGVMKDAPGDYKYAPIHNSSLNRLEWDAMSSGGVTVFQKEKRFSTVGGFVAALPRVVGQQLAAENRSRVAAYFYSPVQPDPAVGKTTAAAKRTVDHALRGQHVFYFYNAAGGGRLSFQKQELNDQLGPDPLTLNLYDRSNRLLDSMTIGDDGDASDLHRPSAARPVEWAPKGLSAGTYRLEFLCDTDVLMKKLTFPGRYLCAAEHVFIDDSYNDKADPSGPAVLYSDARNLTAEIWNPESAQTVRINDSLNLPLAEPFNPVMLTLPAGDKTIRTEKASISLKAPDSFFAFQQGALFDPMPLKTLAYDSRLNQATYDYVIACYTKPRGSGGWLEQSVRLDLADVAPTGSRMYFALSAPGLTEDNKEILIDDLEIRLER